MSHCPHTHRVQDYLDGALAPVEAAAFQEHLETCDACAAELVAFQRLADVLKRAPQWDPGLAFTERVLDHVVPSRVRRRLVTVVGWAYTGATAVSTFSLFTWLTRPDTPHWIAGRLSELYLHALQGMLIALHTLVEGWVRFGNGWDLVADFSGRLSPLARALSLTLAQPVVTVSIAGAFAVSVLMLRWMRPRTGGAVRSRGKEITHVDLLGF
jgi:predicted anti-sigma-YlaC factor YlaD